ncbi:DUF1667 domain-containing protein [uncultured Desulfuromusa sp.]|uniref:DUF1667 domain-containing protein n=1 Tax=uncultured Desulfuromusa sp. TaxID=219183 RepID=UPI002AA8DF83|nr:DUF1667 domain-containing protein [uncultured Desulfuromusa sp.]
MEEKKTLTCIGCPLSCPLQLTIIDGEIQEITGYSCKRGEDYARQEYTAPRRMVSTTIACTSGLWPRLPVKTAAAVPKDKVMAVVERLHCLEISAPVQVGQVILDDVAETGIAVIATRSLPLQETGPAL